ncbi:MAG: ABC transporter ATP-binding protein [Gammaproteobacteria bacterium]|nr:ABC transporter ATP-binding protein [Gammaproteobacteria bacterium]
MSAPVLEVRDLAVEFATESGRIRAVNEISFSIESGEIIGLVGESGCGKTVTGLSVLGLVPAPPGEVVGGQILLNGRDLLTLDEPELRQVRGSEISMIFQEPMTALNPVLTVGYQMVEVLRLHKGLSKKQARNAAIEMLGVVGIPVPAKRIDEYPHEMSGGMRQRVMIAMALSCGPKLLIADEPTTALDVTTQAQVLEEIVRLQQQFEMAVMLITHDLGVVAETCHRAMVMYCGEVVESADIQTLFANPKHPYTYGLMNSIPRIRQQKVSRLPVIEGMVPDLATLPRGCRFADRCSKVESRCREQSPRLGATGDGAVACFKPMSRATTEVPL